VLAILLSLLVATGCIVASLQRLACATAPTSLAPELLQRALLDRQAADTLRAKLEGRHHATLTWERDLLGALSEPDLVARQALIDEQVLELDWLSRRFARIPRVCASISASSGLFFASLAMIAVLDVQADASGQSQVGAAVTLALDALSLGVVGASFSAAILVRSRSAAKARAAVAAALVDRLRTLA
jgi:hypothetical protein